MRSKSIWNYDKSLRSRIVTYVQRYSIIDRENICYYVRKKKKNAHKTSNLLANKKRRRFSLGTAVLAYLAPRNQNYEQ